MKSFQFRLRAVLTLREQAEQEAQQRYARSIAAVNGALARVQAADAAIAASHEARRKHLAAGVRGCELEQARLHTVLLHERRSHFARELADSRQRAEAARRQLAIASQRRQALERLRRRRKRCHDYVAARAEQKVLDELTGRAPTLVEALAQQLSDL